MIDKRVESPAAALADLKDGATVMISGFGGAGVPVALIQALDASGVKDLDIVINAIRFLETHSPALFREKRVRKLTCSAFRGREKEPSNYERQWHAGELRIDLSPQGTFAERIRAGGAGIPAFYTPTAAGTQLDAGKEVREFGGRPCLLETALTADFALLRAAEADRFGNLRFHGSQANFGPAMATAARVAVVEVPRFSETPLPPEKIHLPGVYVDRIVHLSETGAA
ncbi:MAG: 3-oxoacid CoA-transferase subunit A [Alphaproteobacteria bacterium]